MTFTVVGLQWSRGVDAAETAGVHPGILHELGALQWSRGVDAAETCSDAKDVLTRLGPLQWSRGVDAAETGRYHTARSIRYIQQATRAVRIPAGATRQQQ
ncbi:MAG: hypothetical protein HYV93_18030 [Candidatus Rokubacteria bacterium]|nr:hypothetical protein [Candidatus Rokubacteria bacterium]